MFDEIMDQVARKSKEEVSISLGEAVLITVGAFLLGLIMGILCGSSSAKKKHKKCKGKCAHRGGSECADGDDFDAEQYVRDLTFDDE